MITLPFNKMLGTVPPSPHNYATENRDFSFNRLSFFGIPPRTQKYPSFKV